MKNFLLLLAILQAGLFTAIQAQTATMTPASNPNLKFLHHEKPALPNNNTGSAVANHKNNAVAGTNHNAKSLRSLSSGVKLNEQEVGQAGNLLTVDEAGCDQLSTDGPSNSVVFIHRSLDDLNNTYPLYRYDISEDGGNTFTSNVGPITIDPQIDGISVNGRFPQGAIYNPTGGTIADSNYLVYSGTWHNACGSCGGPGYYWEGQLRGVAKLDGDTSTYTVGIDSINGGHTLIATSFCQGAPGVFWNVNVDYSGFLVSTAGTVENTSINGIMVEKGVWNPITKTVDWSVNEIHQQFDSMTSSTGNFSIATAFNIAFDPSGKYGWISCLGDISSTPDSVYQPIFWYSQDSGTTWQGPMQLPLDSLPGVLGNMHTFSYVDSVPMSGVPSTAFEGKLVVDYLGNPHFFTTVGNGSAYNIQIWDVSGGSAPGTYGAGYQAYDFNYKANRTTCDSNWHGWAAKYIDSVETFVGTYTSDLVEEENRPLVSKSADGKKLFFYWLDTDFNGPNMPSPMYDSNEFPNLITRAWDLEHQTMTPVINLTQGDSLFGGSNTLYPYGGIYAPGANFPVIANTAIQNGQDYNVGLILTQIDYTTGQPGVEGSSGDPAAFWYINNITYSPTDFSVGQAINVQVIGGDTEIILLGNSYVDSGAIINYADTSCFSVGPLHLVTDSSNLNIGQTGTYIIYYEAEDSSGNIYGSTSRVVEIVAPPVANFNYSLPDAQTKPYILAFLDLSTNQPTSWLWNFGDHSSDSISYIPSPTHTFPSQSAAAYNVCLTATNAYGHNQKCEIINVTTAINNIGLAQHINLFPNPSTGKVFIAVDASVTSDYTVSVYDMLGNVVVAAVEHKSGSATVEMDLGSLANGTYMVKIQTAGEIAVKRLDLIGK